MATDDKRYQINNDYCSKHGGHDESGEDPDVPGILAFSCFERRDGGTVI